MGRTPPVDIEFARSGPRASRVLARVAISDPQGYFDVRVKFPSTGVVRLSFTPPHGGPEHSRPASVTIS